MAALSILEGKKMQKKLLDLLVVLPQAKVMGSLDKVITDTR